MSAFTKLADVGPLEIWNGVLGRAVEGRHITMAVLELAPKAVVPEHRHPNEQLGFVVKGSMTLTVGGERRQLTAGDAYTIPGDVPHDAVTGPEGAVVVDVFSPVRADWARFTATTPRPPVWP